MRTVLYLGLEPPQEKQGERLIHFPVIEVHPRPFTDPDVSEFFSKFPLYTFAIFTSRSAVKFFFSYLNHFGYQKCRMKEKKIAAVGKGTAGEIKKLGINVDFISSIETAEGLCQTIEKETDQEHYFFWPHSALSRSVISDFLSLKRKKLQECILYDTKITQPKTIPSLNEIDEIIFTSPSTIEGFIKVFGRIPKDKILTTIGPITQSQLFLLRD